MSKLECKLKQLTERATVTQFQKLMSVCLEVVINKSKIESIK